MNAAGTEDEGRERARRTVWREIAKESRRRGEVAVVYQRDECAPGECLETPTEITLE